MPSDRTVQIVMDNEEMGFWHIASEDCPLRAHALALDQKPPHCVSGLITNMQVAVPVNTCKHKAGDIHGEKPDMLIPCSWEAPDAD